MRAITADPSGREYLRVREAGHNGRADPEVLTWAAEEARILLTHDAATMTRDALECLARGAAMPDVIAVQQRLSIRSVVDAEVSPRTSRNLIAAREVKN